MLGWIERRWNRFIEGTALFISATAALCARLAAQIPGNLVRSMSPSHPFARTQSTPEKEASEMENCELGPLLGNQVPWKKIYAAAFNLCLHPSNALSPYWIASARGLSSFGAGKICRHCWQKQFFLFSESLLPDASFNAEYPMKIERLQSPLSALVLVFPSNMVSWGGKLIP